MTVIAVIAMLGILVTVIALTQQKPTDQPQHKDQQNPADQLPNREQQRHAAQLLFEKAHTRAREDASEGLLRLAHSLGEAVKAESPDLEQSIRLHLGGWYRGVHPLRSILVHRGKVHALAFSSDGSRVILTGSADGMTQRWDAVTSAPLGNPVQPGGRILAVAFGLDGPMVVTAVKSTAQVRKADTGAPLGPTLQHEGWVREAVFSRDGKTLLTYVDDQGSRSVQLWDVMTGKPITKPYEFHPVVDSSALSPDGKIVLLGWIDLEGGWVHRWNPAKGKGERLAFSHSGSRVTALATSPDGEAAVAGRTNGTAQTWVLKTSKPHGPLLKHTSAVSAAAFSLDGQIMITGCVDGTARLWWKWTDNQLGSPMRHQDLVLSVAFSPDGKTVTTGGADGTARLWETRTEGSLGLLLNHRSGSHAAVAFSHDSKRVLVAGGEKHLWDAKTGQRLDRLPIDEYATIKAVAFSPDGTLMLTRNREAAQLWEAGTVKPLGPPLGHQGPAKSGTAVFSPDGKTVATAGGETVLLWDVETFKPRGAPLRHESEVLAVAFSRDGETIVTGCADGTARLWEVKTRTLLDRHLKHAGHVYSVAFSPDGRTVLTGCADGAARLWDVKTAKPLILPLRHEDKVLAVTFHPNGQVVLTAGRDKKARLWEVATGRPVGPPLWHSGDVWDVAFSPDGTRFVTGADANAHLREAPVSVTGEVEHIILWVQVITGMELKEDGEPQVLDASTWEERRERLKKLGGPPLP